jgi:soluble lytic murein transglycosylase-like protein
VAGVAGVRRLGVSVGCAIALTGAAAASWAASGASGWGQWPAPCVSAVAREARLSKSLLQAIVWVESRGVAWAIHRNEAGRGAPAPASDPAAAWRWLRTLDVRRANVDIGLMQINTRHLARFGLRAEQLLEPCLNLRVGAWLLNEVIARHGETWRAIMRYNGRRPSYAHRVREAWARFRALERAERGGW